MAVATNVEKPKANSFLKAPKLSKTSLWILSLGGFLIIFFLLFSLGNNEKAITADLQATLQDTTAGVVKPQDINSLQDTLLKEQKQYASLQSKFPGAGSTVVTLDNFMKLAASCDIDIISSELTTGSIAVPQGSATVTLNCYTYRLGLAGEVARIQNFMLGLSKFPTTYIREMIITPSPSEAGTDIAAVTVSCVLKGK